MPNVFTKDENKEIQEQKEKLWRQAKAIAKKDAKGNINWPHVISIYKTLKKKKNIQLSPKLIPGLPLEYSVLASIPTYYLLRELILNPAVHRLAAPQIVEKRKRKLLLDLINRIKRYKNIKLLVQKSSKYGPHAKIYMGEDKESTIVMPKKYLLDPGVFAHEWGHTINPKTVEFLGSIMRSISPVTEMGAVALSVPSIVLGMPYVGLPLIALAGLTKGLGALPEMIASHKGGMLLYNLGKRLSLKERIKLYLSAWRGVPSYLI